MARNENPPFSRGETFFNGLTADTSVGVQLEGKEWVFEDVDPTTTGHTSRTNRYVRCRCVRNVSGIALLPKRLAAFATAGVNAAGTADGRTYGAQVSGYTTTVNARGYPIDEWLPAAGAPANDLFWIVIEGPAKVLTPLATASADFAIGDLVAALTAVTSQATSAGRVDDVNDLTALTVAATMQNKVLHYIGYALSAVSSSSTNSDLLVEVGHW